jgi:hypothetical protein
MGWKAAQKLIRHWKILRGDNVREEHSKSFQLLFNVFYDLFFGYFIVLFQFELFGLNCCR